MIRGDIVDPLCLCSPDMTALVQSGLLYKDEYQAALGFILFCRKNYDTATTGQEETVIDL